MRKCALTSLLFLRILVVLSVSGLLPGQHSPAFGAPGKAPSTLAATPKQGLVASVPMEPEIKSKLDSVRIPFIRNQAQLADETVKFFAMTMSGAVFVQDGRIRYALEGGDPLTEPETNGTLSESFSGCKNTGVEGLTPSRAVVSYFLGSREEAWKRNIPTFETVGIKGLYENIDLELRLTNKNTEKVFTVQKGGDPRGIHIAVSGAERLEKGGGGEMEVRTRRGIVRMTAPVAFQTLGERKVEVRVAYRLIDEATYGFEVGDYDRDYPLVIDPTLISTFVGHLVTETGHAVAASPSGRIYVAGRSNSPYFPTKNKAFDIVKDGGFDIVICRFSEDLRVLESSTFLGGISDEWVQGIALDQSGDVYVTGYTASVDFPTKSGAYDENIKGSQDVFVAKVDESLTSLLASTYIGGSSYDLAMAIALDSEEHVYIAGHTQSTDFPVRLGLSYDVYYSGSTDGFICKFDKDLHRLISSTFLGGTASDQIFSMALDDSGGLYVVGVTKSKDFPTTPYAIRRDFQGGSSDAFVARLDRNLCVLKGGTFLGGSDDETAYAVAIGHNHDAYVVGFTSSIDFPIAGKAFDTRYNGDEDAFVVRIQWRNDKTVPRMALLASTFLGGKSLDIAKAVAVDGSGRVFVAGYTTSMPFPMRHSDTFYSGDYVKGEDIFVAQFNEYLSRLQNSTYLGASSNEQPNAMIIDSGGRIIMTGVTNSIDYPRTEDVYRVGHGSPTKEELFISILPFEED